MYTKWNCIRLQLILPLLYGRDSVEFNPHFGGSHKFDGNLFVIRGMRACTGILPLGGFPAQIVWEAELNCAISKVELTGLEELKFMINESSFVG